MNEDQRQEGGIITVEADAIIHTMNPDLITLSDKNRNVCSGFVQGLLQDDPDFSAPPVFEQEYLLDGRPIENNHCDHAKGSSSYIPKVDQFSTDMGKPNNSPHGDSAESNHIAGLHQNSASDELRNGARAKVSFNLDSPGNQSKQKTDWSVLNQKTAVIAI
uniref:KBTBB n=1 Tax=Poeciliopsis prolifica TaxID=188132 RepID=A0A0S7ER16_9TELE